MRTLGLILALALAAGCAPPKSQIRYVDGADLARYRMIGVLPFVDSQGRGREISRAIASGLAEKGFAIVDTANIESVFQRFKPDAEIGLGITELTELKQTTHAQALITGSVDAENRRAVMSMVDTDLGDEIFRATLHPVKMGKFQSTREIVDQALGLFKPSTGG